MFERLFTCMAAIERHQAAPLVEERTRYLEHFEKLGVQRHNLRKQAANLLRLIRLLELVEGRPVSVAEVQAAAVEWWQPGMPGYLKRGTVHTRSKFVADSLRWLRFLGWLEEREKLPRHPHTAEVAAFAAWARRERGYAEETVEGCCQVTDRFFAFLAEGNTALRSVTIVDVDRAIAAMSARGDLSRRTIESFATRLKVFFRFAEEP